jgi:4-hydroxy-tetrahydrodipicolinate reductase
MKKYKVIVWGLGNVGRAAIRMIMEKQTLELVGAIDVDPNKIGKDAGEVFDFGKTGVTVSDDIEKVFAMDADVILDYTPLVRDSKGGFTPSAMDVCKALRAKKNVITTIPIYYSQVTTPELYKMINECAKENDVTFLPSGLLPGAYASYIPMVISGIMGRVDKIVVESGEDDQHNYSSWVKVFGYGADPKAFPCERLKMGIESYYVSGVYEMGDRLGFEFDEVKTTHEVFTAPEDLHPIFGTVKKGTISGHRFTMSGFTGGEEKVTLRYVHKICHDVAPEPPVNDKIHIEGLPGDIDVDLKGMMPLDESYVTSAAPTVNIIPAVVEAQPGFRQAMDLPVVVPIR